VVVLQESVAFYISVYNGKVMSTGCDGKKVEAIEADVKKALQYMKFMDEKSKQQVQEVQFGNMKLAYVDRRSGWSHNYKDPKARDLAHEAVKYECAMMIGLWQMKLETVAALPYWFEAQASAAPLYGSFGKRIFSTYLSQLKLSLRKAGDF